MNGRQVMVLWLGIGLIAMNLFFTGQWTLLKGQLTVKAAAPATPKVFGQPIKLKPVHKGNGTA